MNSYDNIRGEYPVFDFESFIFSAETPFPDNRILDFLSLGPFVLHTDGSFEAEHFYEREKILCEDYMASDGGERSAVPVLGGAVKNIYYGDEYLYWKKGFIKWNCLRFDNDEDACDPALYVTQQRNAVYYAAFYVRCKKESKAVICYENSGSELFINGESVDFKPFGRVKGLWGLGFQCPVTFRQGLNLVMFKIRPGYIADSMDIAMSNCSVFPVIIDSGDLWLTTPSVTAAYTGERGCERQVFPAFAAAVCDTEEGCISYGFGEIKLPAMKKGQVVPVRFEIPAPENGCVKAEVLIGDSRAEYFFPVSVYDGFEGNEHIYSDFHFDTTYHQEQRTYALGAMHITKSIIERLMSNPDFKATLSEIDYLHPYYSLYPAHRQVLRDMFSSGRAEADCFYNQPNDLTSSGEAFVRNLAYGQLYHRDVLGRLNNVYQPGDVFGHFSQLTQICKKGGCDYIKWGKMMLGVDSLYRHVSPDGTSLLHDKNMGRADAARLGVTGCDASSGALSYMEAYPREGDTSWMKNTVSNASFSVFSELARDVNSSAERSLREGTGKIDYCSRDITQHHSGVLLTRTDFKQANRLCENLLVTAEKFSCVAFMYGKAYPDKAIDKAQRQLLCAQHHDSITGTNNEISFIDLMIEYRECAHILTSVIEDACSYIASLVKTDKREDCVFVFNPLTWERGGICYFNVPEKYKNEKYLTLTDIKGREYTAEVKDGRGSFYAVKLPAMGYGVFRVSRNAAENKRLSDGCVIENSRFRIECDPARGGAIVSLYDKKEKKELVDSAAAAPANTVYVLKEIHDRMETQHELYTTGHKLLSSDFEADVKSEKTSFYQKLIIKVKLDTVAGLIQEITLYKGSDTVDFRCTVEDYQSEDDLFCVTFPLDIKGSGVLFDDRFAPHVSTRSKKYMSFQTHQYASFSGCRVLPSNLWFGVGPTVTARLGEAAAFNFGMTAVIRKEEAVQKELSDRLLFALTKKAVPVTLYSDREQHGGRKIIHFNEDIYSTDTRIVVSLTGDGNEYVSRLTADIRERDKARIERLIASRGAASVYFRDSDNAYKKSVDVLLLTGKTKEALEGLVARIESALQSGRVMPLDDTVITCDAPESEDYGCVLINNGTPAASVEGKATLNMMLFHTAAFYGNMGKVTGGKELVPEQKSHIFTYSLYPHKGSYAEAGVYKRAYEFNDTPFGILSSRMSEKPTLPEEKAFLKAPDNFTVTAFKAAGYPYANLKKVPESPFERGFTVRGFENSGLSSKVNLHTGFTVFGASAVNLLEEEPVALKTGADSVSIPTGPYSVETAILKVPCRTPEDREHITSYPLYIRSWEHDMGSAPLGNLGFAATIERLPRGGTQRETLFINTVNNLSREAVSARINIVCSEGISADREFVDVNIEGGGFERIPVEVCSASESLSGLVKIFYTFDGVEYYDVWEAGLFEPEMSLKIEKDKIRVNIYNPTDEILTGELSIASPFETWGEDIPDALRFGSISPFMQFVELRPREERLIELPVTLSDDIQPSFWAAAKLGVNGRIYFAFDKSLGMRHNVWAHEFFSEIIKDNGSIRKIIEM